MKGKEKRIKEINIVYIYKWKEAPTIKRPSNVHKDLESCFDSEGEIVSMLET